MSLGHFPLGLIVFFINYYPPPKAHFPSCDAMTNKNLHLSCQHNKFLVIAGVGGAGTRL